ncbi:MAG: hypothetical protein R3B91_01910 [Planctomycetaceae bacterium]
MQVFVSEYVCGGGWPDPDLPHSLDREGLAMLRAILSDFARIPDCHVVTTLDHRRPDLNIDGVRVVRVADSIQEQQQFRDLAVQSNVCLVIAPELGNVLYDRCVLAREAGASCVLNPVSETIQQCSDKLQLARFLDTNDIQPLKRLFIGKNARFQLRTVRSW